MGAADTVAMLNAAASGRNVGTSGATRMRGFGSGLPYKAPTPLSSSFASPLRSFASGAGKEDDEDFFPNSWVEPDALLEYMDKDPETFDLSELEDRNVQKELGKRNEAWRQRVLETRPELFAQIAAGQAPKYFWLGCSDSRVAPENLIDANPGEVFVHRNIGNVAAASCMNFRSALHFGLEYLKIQHIIVCGHYECGAIKAASNQHDHQAPVETWLTHIRDVMRLHQDELEAIIDPYERHKRLVELNVIEQCLNLYKTGDVQRKRAESAGSGVAFPRIHAMVFSPADGILRKLDVNFKAYMAKYKNIYGLYDKKEMQAWASYLDPL